MHKAKLNKAKFHFFEKGEKRAKSYQYFRLTSVRLSLGLENLEKCSMLIVKKKFKANFVLFRDGPLRRHSYNAVIGQFFSFTIG